MGAAEKERPELAEALRTLAQAMLRDVVREVVREEFGRVLATISPEPANSPLLSTKQASEYLGISPEALRKHVSRNHLAADMPGNRKGGLRGSRFSMETLIAFKNRGRSGAADGKKK